MVKKRVVRKAKEEKKVSEVKVQKSPIGLRIASAIYFVMGALTLMSGVGVIINPNEFATQINSAPEIAATGVSIESGAIMLMGGMMCVFGLLVIGLAWKLFKRKNWARIITIVFSAITVITSLGGIVRLDLLSIFYFLLHLTVIYFLVLDKEVQKIF